MLPVSSATRRELVAAAVVGSLGAAAAADAQPADDARALRAALRTELLVVFVYERILALGLLAPAAQRTSTRLLAQERAHVRSLTAALAQFGETSPAGPVSVAQADGQLAARSSSGSLSAVRTGSAALRLLYDVESIAIGSYYQALTELVDVAAVRTASEIMANEAQHATSIGELLHHGDIKKTVPVSVVKGKR